MEAFTRMAQLLISCFSVVLLCVTWIATSTGEDVLDNLGVEAHPFQEGKTEVLFVFFRKCMP